MRVPVAIEKSVGFIARKNAPDKFLGTAFLVGIRMSHQPGCMVHLVTAKHVVIQMKEDECILAVNGKDGSRINLDVITNGWFYHPTEPDCVDVAITVFIPTTPNVSNYDVSFVDECMLGTRDRMKAFNIGIGDEVITVGLFSGFPGTRRLTPIVRTGNIAMLPIDRIPHRSFGSIEAYLIEGTSTGGFSGSPVFVRDSVFTHLQDQRGGKREMHQFGQLHLLGLTSGHYELPGNSTTGVEQSSINMGVTIVVPAAKIVEALYHPELVNIRAIMDNPKNVEVVETW